MRKFLGLVWVGLLCVIGISSAAACGGLFCQNIPVDQQAERIIFAVNKNGTVTAYVQINYTGEAPDFSWVVPVPNTPKVDVADKASFDELSNLTAPIFVSPLMPNCAPIVMPMAAMSDAGGAIQEGSVQVLASGTAGPYAYDVITSPNPAALVTWLRKNNYRITEQMEPLVKVYTDEGMVFLAMKLQPNQGVQDIQPVVMTYQSLHPMIPLRLTAVAANANMSIITWILGDGQALPTNYAHPVIHDDDLRSSFFAAGGTNYLQMVDDTVDLYQGRAFITEYAGATTALLNAASDPLVKKLLTDYPYMTRMFGRISPEEMTIDPTFELANDAPDVSNVHDLSKMKPEQFWGCEGYTDQPKPIFDPAAVPAGFQ